MDLSKLSDQLLVTNAVFHAKSERKRMHLVLLHIAEIERRGIFADYGYSSMCKFVSQEMGYGDKAAYERWSAAKLLVQVPQLHEKLEEGVINLTQVSQVRSCLIQEKKAGKKVSSEQVVGLFDKVASKNTFQTKQILAETFDHPVQIVESVQPQKDGSARFTTTFSAEMLREIETLKALCSHQSVDGNLEELLLPLVRKEIERIKGSKKTGSFRRESAVTHGEKYIREIKEVEVRQIGQVGVGKKEATGNIKMKFESAENSDEQSENVRLIKFGIRPKRRSISLNLWRFVMDRAQYQCEFQNPATGKKCDEIHYLEIDHKIPVALGGSNRISNLRVLCRTHNQAAAKKLGLVRPGSDASFIR